MNREKIKKVNWDQLFLDFVSKKYMRIKTSLLAILLSLYFLGFLFLYIFHPYFYGAFAWGYVGGMGLLVVILYIILFYMIVYHIKKKTGELYSYIDKKEYIEKLKNIYKWEAKFWDDIYEYHLFRKRIVKAGLLTALPSTLYILIMKYILFPFPENQIIGVGVFVIIMFGSFFLFLGVLTYSASIKKKKEMDIRLDEFFKKNQEI